MKESPEFKESMERFDRLFRAAVAVPKSEVEKEEAKDRHKNRRIREKRKAAKATKKR